MAGCGWGDVPRTGLLAAAGSAWHQLLVEYGPHTLEWIRPAAFGIAANTDSIATRELVAGLSAYLQARLTFLLTGALRRHAAVAGDDLVTAKQIGMSSWARSQRSPTLTTRTS